MSYQMKRAAQQQADLLTAKTGTLHVVAIVHTTNGCPWGVVRVD